jgi:hypothetical protein
MLDSAMSTAWPRWVISAMPLATVGTMAGERPSKGSSRRSIWDRGRARARWRASCARRPTSRALAGPVFLQDGEDLVGEGQPLGGGAVLRDGSTSRSRYSPLPSNRERCHSPPARTPPEPRDLVGAPLVERHLVEADATAPGAMVAHDGAECRGLPRAVAPHQHTTSRSRTSRDTRRDVARLDEDVDVPRP